MVKIEPVVKKFYDSLDEGKILSLKCKRCGSSEYPPVTVCSNCSGTDLEWAEISGDAKLLEFGWVNPIIASMGDPSFLKYMPYHYGSVELKEGGPTINGMIFGITDETKETIKNNLPYPLEAEIIQLQGFKTVVWRIEGTAPREQTVEEQTTTEQSAEEQITKPGFGDLIKIVFQSLFSKRRKKQGTGTGFSQDSTLGELFNDPAAAEILDKYVPEMSTHPQRKMAEGFSLKVIAGFPQVGISAEILAKIDAELRALGD